MKSVSVSQTLKHSHSLINDVVLNTAQELQEAVFVVKIDSLLVDRGLTQKELAQMTGIRVGTVSEWVNGKNLSINKVQLLAIMGALRCTKISDIIEVVLPVDLEEQYIKEAKDWSENKHMPENVRELYRTNVLKSAGL